jgi:hypothetical protein
MPQTTYLPVWRAEYPLLCVAQKPGGVTVATNAAAPRVPNKPTYVAGTIQSFESLLAAVAEWDEQQAQAKAAAEESVAEEEPVVEEEDEEEVEEDDGNGGTTRRRRPKSRRR